MGMVSSLEVCRQCDRMLSAGLRPGKAAGAAFAGGTGSQCAGERGHAGGDVSVHRLELSGTAVLCVQGEVIDS